MESSEPNHSPPDPRLGRTFSGYRVVRKIAEGGMGAVYEAVHCDHGGRAAIKVMLPELLNSPDAASRFLNEARAVSLVAHPSLVQIYGHGTTPDGEAYIAMEYIDGESLQQRMRNRYLGGSALGILRQLAAGLTATHAKRIVHRDLKPDNIMLLPDAQTRGGLRVKILDFGIAKLLPTTALEGERPAFKTRTGTLIGTPTYMSPEQCRASSAEPPDEKTDVYALGIILYELLCGEPPFISDSAGELFALQMFAPPPDLKERMPELPPAVAALTHRLLEKKPAGRPAMAELLRELEALPDTNLQDGPPETRPCERAVAARALSPGTAEGPATSGLIRKHLNVPNRTTGQSSRGEQVSPAAAAPSRLPLVLSGGFFLLCLAALFLTLFVRRSGSPHHIAAVATAATVAPADLATTTTPPTPLPPAVEPAKEGAAASSGTAPLSAPTADTGDYKAGRDAAHRSSRKEGVPGRKRQKFQIDVWK